MLYFTFGQMLGVLLAETFLDWQSNNNGQKMLVIFGFIAEYFEFFLFEQEQTISCAYFLSFAVDSLDLRIYQLRHDKLTI